MDMNLSSFSILVSFFIFLAALIKLTTSKSKCQQILNLPPGPTRLPLIGNLHLFASFQPPHRIITHLSRKYGSVMRLQLGEVTTIVVSSSEAAKRVLKTQSVAFTDRPSLLAGEILCYDNTDIAFAPYGHYWRQLRKICTLELLSTKRVQSFWPVRQSEFFKLCRWMASNGGSLINFTEKVGLTICDTVMLASLGKMASELAMFISIAKDASTLMAILCIFDMYPSIELFGQITGLRGRLERLHKLSDSILENVINDHKVAKAKSRQQEDLVDVLLKFNKTGHELYLTTENIKAVLQDMIGGGIETSSTVIDWAMAEMLKQPRILKLVIKETLRMHPPIPLLLPRVSCEPCKIDGYEIPERYLDNPIDFKGNNFEYIPFGGGRRICPGMTFGIANVELPLAMLLFHFDWALPDGMKHPPQP